MSYETMGLRSYFTQRREKREAQRSEVIGILETEISRLSEMIPRVEAVQLPDVTRLNDDEIIFGFYKALSGDNPITAYAALERFQSIRTNEPKKFLLDILRLEKDAVSGSVKSSIELARRAIDYARTASKPEKVFNQYINYIQSSQEYSQRVADNGGCATF